MANSKALGIQRPRDSQRSRLYAAEQAVGGYGSNGGQPLPTMADIEAYLDKLTSSAWFRRRWDRVYPGTYRLRNGAGNRKATGGMNDLTYPRWSRYEWMVLHELAHHIVERHSGSSTQAWHGWMFCSVLLELVEHAFGAEMAKRFKAEMKKRNVKYTKPRAKQPMSEERKAQLREQLAAARAVREANAARAAVEANIAARQAESALLVVA